MHKPTEEELNTMFPDFYIILFKSCARCILCGCANSRIRIDTLFFRNWILFAAFEICPEAFAEAYLRFIVFVSAIMRLINLKKNSFPRTKKEFFCKRKKDFFHKKNFTRHKLFMRIYIHYS